MMRSKITGGETRLLFTAKVLNKYTVKYYQCLETGFIQTEEPYWLEEAYSSAITKLDIGLSHRNELLRDSVGKILLDHFDYDRNFLDYAGGYGLFTRLMRDKGFNYYHTDNYCRNIFAEYFDLADIGEDSLFELVTAFEVFEHMSNPKEEIKKIFSFSDNVLFTTELQPKISFKSAGDWWYFVPDTGQHISLYTEKSLQYLAKEYGYNFYTDGFSLHLLTKRSFIKNPLKPDRDPFLIRNMKKYIKKYDQKRYPFSESLLQRDWEYIKNKLS